MTPEKPVIALVGPCAAGKTTLAMQLEDLGYQVRQVAQEHSYVPDMWQVIAKPDFLVFLDVSYQVSISRSGNSWEEKIFNKQLERLKHAREHADLYLDTDHQSKEQIAKIVIRALEEKFSDRSRNI